MIASVLAERKSESVEQCNATNRVRQATVSRDMQGRELGAVAEYVAHI